MIGQCFKSALPRRVFCALPFMFCKHLAIAFELAAQHFFCNVPLFCVCWDTFASNSIMEKQFNLTIFDIYKRVDLLKIVPLLSMWRIALCGATIVLESPSSCFTPTGVSNKLVPIFIFTFALKLSCPSQHEIRRYFKFFSKFRAF